MSQSLVQNIQHTVFSTQDRYGWIDEAWEEDLFKKIGGILNKLGCILIAAGAYDDHIHLLSKVEKTMSTSKFVSKVKSASSFWIHRQIQGKKKFAWQKGYSSFSVSKSQIPVVKKYILQQRDHHRKQGYQDELKALLTRHDLKYDERYLWN